MNGGASIFAFLLCNFTVIHFAVLVLWHRQPGHSEHAMSHHFTTPIAKIQKCPNTHTFSLSLKVLLGFRLVQQLLTPQWEFDGLSLIGHLSNGHLSCLPGHLFGHTCHLHALLQQTKEGRDTLIWLCLDVTRVYVLTDETLENPSGPTPNQVNLTLSLCFNHCV